MDRAFIQFYFSSCKYRGPTADRLGPVTTLHNGFSYVWDDANPVWVDFHKADLPIYADEIYVSCVLAWAIEKVVRWARQYPDIKFIVGGPAVWPGKPHLEYIQSLPKNIEYRSGYAENIFSRPVDLKTWKLIPPENTADANILYSYHIKDECDWSRCKFCRNTAENHYLEKYEAREFDLAPLHDAPPGLVYLAADSIPPKDLYILRELNYDNKYYRAWVRGTEPIYNELKKILPDLKSPEKLSILIGVEFPSNRMLQFMRKGTTVESLIRVINLITDYGSRVRLSFIIGWPNLIDDDLTEAEHFFRSLSNYTGELHHVSVNQLSVWPNGILAEYVGKPKFYKSMLLSHAAVLSTREKDLNDKWRQLLKRQPNVILRKPLSALEEEETNTDEIQDSGSHSRS